MRAQVTLTPTESKKLLAKALAGMAPIKRALERGLVVIHPSSTTIFLVEELTGKRPKGLWACGVIVPEGTCFSRERRDQREQEAIESKKKTRGPGHFPFSWVLEKGSFQTGLLLSSILDKMGTEDVYIKGANAIDPQGKVGVLYAAPAAGSIGMVGRVSKRIGFAIYLPIGLEKLIPTPIENATKFASRTKTDLAMGTPVGLIHVSGEVVTEVEAIHILSGAEAVAVAAGGLGGAEGSLTLVIKGPKEKVSRSFQILKDVKGAKLPKIYPTECEACPYIICHLNKNFKRKD
jgi:hypothetical protein